MKEIKIGKITFIKLIYSILIIIFLISAFLPYYSLSFTPHIRHFMGYIELLYGGWPGLALTVISVILLNFERKYLSLLIGGLGCALIGINLIIQTFSQIRTIELGFYIGFILWIGLCVVNGSTFVFIGKEKKQKAVKTKLLESLNNIETLIAENKITEASKSLVDIKNIAKDVKLHDVLENIEERIEFCKNLEIENINKIKSTITKYAGKMVRLELADISEKSSIQDENLIERIILEMIKNQEINAEYFSSSRSIAFYQQEKEIVPRQKQEDIRELRVFLSYSTLDSEHFQVSDIVKNLEIFPQIKKVSYWQADSKQNIVEFMEETLKITDVFVLLCSKNSVKSKAVKDEWQAAFQMRKKELLKIIPVYEDENHIPVLLWQMLNVQYVKDNFDEFIQILYEEILR